MRDGLDSRIPIHNPLRFYRKFLSSTVQYLFMRRRFCFHAEILQFCLVVSRRVLHDKISLPLLC